MDMWQELGLGVLVIALGALVITQSIISMRARIKTMREAKMWDEWERKNDDGKGNDKVA